mmetsp:Transcript_16372/g.51459  ORF Transcript_16372/g.51459 Transcript_16372/m.51459 type:complete len:339 (-) Transcript_16372:25-1041(-)
MGREPDRRPLPPEEHGPPRQRVRSGHQLQLPQHPGHAQGARLGAARPCTSPGGGEVGGLSQVADGPRPHPPGLDGLAHDGRLARVLRAARDGAPDAAGVAGAAPALDLAPARAPPRGRGTGLPPPQHVADLQAPAQARDAELPDVRHSQRGPRAACAPHSVQLLHAGLRERALLLGQHPDVPQAAGRHNPRGVLGREHHAADGGADGDVPRHLPPRVFRALPSLEPAAGADRLPARADGHRLLRYHVQVGDGAHAGGREPLPLRELPRHRHHHHGRGVHHAGPVDELLDLAGARGAAARGDAGRSIQGELGAHEEGLPRDAQGGQRRNRQEFPRPEEE